MIVLLLFVCLVILILFQPKSDEDADVPPACNMAAWLLAIGAFVILLSVASLVGIALSDPRIVATLGGAP